MLSPRSGSCRAITAVLLAVLVLSSAAAAAGRGGGVLVSGSGRSLAASASVGLAELESARSSLASGAGPAQRGPASCGSPTGSSVRCELAIPATSPAAPFPYTWSNLTSSLTGAPSARVSTMAWDASDGYVLLFGGGTNTATFSDTWTYSNGTWANITGTVSGAPPPLVLTSMAFDPSTQAVILFGGEGVARHALAETWSYHAKAWSNLTGSAGVAPSPRIGGENMATDTTDNEIVLYGGNLTNPGFSDTWTFSDGKWKNVTAVAGLGSTVILPVLTNDPAEHGVLMFGILIYNATRDVYRSATYVYSGGVWKNLTATLSSEPPIPYLSTGAYLSGPGAVVAFIPVTVNSTGSPIFASTTWAFVGGAWVNLTASAGYPPYLGLFAATAVNAADDTIIGFGGEFNGGFADATWVFSEPPVVSAAAAGPTSIDAGMSVDLRGSVQGGVAPVSEGWSFSSGPASSSGGTDAPIFSSPGSVVATFTATDFLGRTASTSVAIVVAPALAASINVTPSSPTANAGTAFSADLTGGTAPFTFSWNFGDGSTASGPGVAHVYGSSGTYTVSLIVRDAAGKNASTSIKVAIGSSTAFSLTAGAGLGLLLGLIVLALIAVALAVLLFRKPRHPAGAPAPYVAPSASPPPPPPSGPPPPPT